MNDLGVDNATDGLPRPDGRFLWRQWVRAMMFGELVGFAAPAVAGTIAYRSGFSNWWMFATLVVAGSFEGAALGFAQSTVLDEEFPNFPRRAWIAATAGAAALAWALGMLPSSLGSFTEDHPAVVISAAVVLAPVLLNSIGVAQWFVLRRLVPGPAVWIPANALAWLAGLPAVFVAMMSVPDDAPVVRRPLESSGPSQWVGLSPRSRVSRSSA